ncbi:MAG: AsmA family protein, partial [Betaproteobacteria bacterium]
MNLQPKISRVLMLTSAGVCAALFLIALCILAFVDVNNYKPQVEALLSERAGMSVTIEGTMTVAFTPMPGVSMANIRVVNQGIELAYVKKADIAVDLLPLLWGQIRYGTISTHGTRVAIVRDHGGHYNYQRPPGAVGVPRLLNLPKVNFTELVVTYLDQQSDDGFESAGCDGVLTGIHHPGGSPLLQQLSMQGKFECTDVHGKTNAITDLKFAVSAIDGVFDFKPVTMRVFGGKGAVTLRMDRTGESPTYKISVALSKFHIDQFFNKLKSGRSVNGLMDFSTTLAMRGRTRMEMRQSVGGEMSLSGTDLTLVGMDLDSQLVKFESSQNLSLVDVGALLFAGPVGLVVT